MITTTCILVFGIIYAWWKGDEAMSFDDIMDLKWLFRSRRKGIDLETIRPLIAQRAFCSNRGKVAPWTSKPCECTGYQFAKWRRGVEYCVCGCGRMGHFFKKP